MKTTNWRENPLVLPILGIVGGLLMGFVFGFSIDRDQGWRSLTDLLPTYLTLIGFNLLFVWFGQYPEIEAAPRDLIRPAILFAIILGPVTAGILILRDQGVSFSITAATVAAAGVIAFMLASSSLQSWVRSRRP